MIFTDSCSGSWRRIVVDWSLPHENLKVFGSRAESLPPSTRLRRPWKSSRADGVLAWYAPPVGTAVQRFAVALPRDKRKQRPAKECLNELSLVETPPLAARRLISRTTNNQKPITGVPFGHQLPVVRFATPLVVIMPTRRMAPFGWKIFIKLVQVRRVDDKTGCRRQQAV